MAVDPTAVERVRRERAGLSAQAPAPSRGADAGDVERVALGLVILDDCDWPSVATAVRYFELNLGWMPVPLEGDTRLRAFRLPETRPSPGFDQFVPFSTDPVRRSRT